MAFNTSNFILFIDYLSETLQNKNFTKALFIMDNVPFHKAVWCSKLLKEMDGCFFTYRLIRRS
jgi:hypothetical protein